VQDRATEFLPSGSAGDEAGNAPYELVRQRVQALISAARDLSDTCADLADALRPLPGQDEPGGHDFGRLRAERTAALLDEAASAARGTLGLLHSAYSALERQMGRPPAPEAAPVPRGGLSTWPDAFVELPPRTFAVEEGAGAVPAARCTEPPPGEGVWRSPEARTGAGLGGPGSRPEAVEWAADAGHREAAGWSADTSPADTSPTDTSPTDTSPTDPSPTDTRPADTRPADTRPADTRPADTGRVDTRPADDGHATAAPAAVDHGPTDHEPTDHGRPGHADADLGNIRRAETEYAETEYAETEYAETGYPDTEYADTGYPDTGYPDTGYPETDNPDFDHTAARHPDTGYPETDDPDFDHTAARHPDTRYAIAAQGPAGHAGTEHDDAGHGTTARAAAGLGDVEDADDRGPHSAEAAAHPDHADTDHADTDHAFTDHASAAPADADPAGAGGPDAASTAIWPAAAGHASTGPQDVGSAGEPAGWDGPGQDEGVWRTDAGLGSPGPGTSLDSPGPGASLSSASLSSASLSSASLESSGADAPDVGTGPAGPDPNRDAGRPDGDWRPAGVPGHSEEILDLEAGPDAAPTPRDGLAVAAFAGWVAVDPDDENAAGRPILDRKAELPWRPADREDDPPARAVAAEHPPPPVISLPVEPHTGEGAGWRGDTVSPEPRSLSLVPPVPDPEPEPEPYPGRTAPSLPYPDPWRDEASAPMPAPDPEPWAADPRSTWQPVPGLASRPAWAAEVVPGASAAGDGLPVYPLDGPADAEVPPRQSEPVLASALDDPGAAVIARQVEAARRHLQAALVLANQPEAAPRLGALLTAVERVLTAVTDLARETRGVLESGLTERTFPGEARFLCNPPWEHAQLVGRDAYGEDVASPAGLAKLLRSLGYEATSVTSAGGVAGVQIRSDRYAAHVALVEPAGGGRQRWSGALEWTDPSGASRTWAETLGPVDVADEELARRVDELLRRCVGPTR